MYFTKHINSAVIRFKRFSRATYAVFQSMHRVVNIGHVASYIADCQMRKATGAMLVVAVLTVGSVSAQKVDDDDSRDPILLPTLTVAAMTDTVESSPDAVAVISQHQLKGITANSVGELLKQLPGVDLRTRGGNDVQGDLTLRGGTFDQVLVLLNGINISDPQTGHHNLDIPIDLAMVDRVEVIPSAALLHYGLTSYCGAINIVTTECHRDRLRFILSGGSFGQANLSAGATKVMGPWTVSANASYRRSDGYRTNTDFRHGSLFLQARRQDSIGLWHLQLGGQVKDFGSQAFYSTAYPDQYEATRTLTASVNRQRMWKGIHLEASLYGRLHRDRFELFRHDKVVPPAWYADHNYHFSNSEGLRLRAAKRFGITTSTIGTELRRDAIVSNVLGKPLAEAIPVRFESGDHSYTHGTSRLSASCFVEEGVDFSWIHVAATGLLSYNNFTHWNYAYGLNARMPLGPNTLVRASVGRSWRLPTFTDLYYHSATQISNPNLQAEVSHHAEINMSHQCRQWTVQGTLFARHGTNVIDWIRQPEETVWHCVNHAAVDALGGDVAVSYSPKGFVYRVDGAYSYCTLAQKADDYISNYVLDYLRHKLSFSVVLAPVTSLHVKLMVDYRYRVGSYTDNGVHLYQPVWLVNASAEYLWKQFVFFVEGYNLLNAQYLDYGGVPQPGVSFLAGVKLNVL